MARAAVKNLGPTSAGGPPQDVVYVNEYTGGLIGPGIGMLGPVKSGGRIRTSTPPGCWSPMITPSFMGGHEVTRPVAVAGAEPGDALVIRLVKCRNISTASSSGVGDHLQGRYNGDPFVAKVCPGCGANNPESFIEGIGPEAVRCKVCGTEASPFRFAHGYTMVIDNETNTALTVPPKVAEKVATHAREFHHSPEHTEAHPILLYAAAQMPGVVTRVSPFLGNIGTTPARDMPDSHNAGDFGSFLIGAPHDYAFANREDLDAAKTDGHMDCNQVREGAVLICPVKVSGGGVYLGDMHAMQGNGEVAGHATDSASDVELEVEVIKGLKLDGPILLPVLEDLPPLARPVTKELRANAIKLAKQYDIDPGLIEETAPITVIGGGPTLNDATKNGLQRAADLTGLSYAEIQNRATVTGSIEIGRLPGIVKVGFLCPMPILEKLGIAGEVKRQYGL